MNNKHDINITRTNQDYYLKTQHSCLGVPVEGPKCNEMMIVIVILI